MVDTLTREQRSVRMGRIRSKNTLPEMRIRKALYSYSYRYRLHDPRLPGNPDLVFPSRKTVVFVNGCFWHGHRCNIGHLPKSNSNFWYKKIKLNRSRDARNIRHLRSMGWNVLIVWECEIGTTKRVEATMARLTHSLDRHSQH